MDWRFHRLEELTEPSRPITYGVVKPGPEDPKNGVKFIRGGDIFEGRLAIENLRTITTKVSNSYSRTLLSGGELVVSLVGNPGHVAVVPKSLAGANLARQAGLVALRNEIDVNFVKYFLMSPQGRAELFAQMTGSVQVVINLHNLKTVRVPLPSLPVQQRIADILSTYDELIENSQQRIGVLEAIARALYREWFTHFRFPGYENVSRIASPLGDIPQGWEVRRLGEIAEDMRRNVPKGELEEPTPYVGLEHIPRRALALDAWETVTELGSNKFEFKKGEILFGKIRPYFHKCSVAPFDGVCSADTIVIRARHPEYYATVVACVSSDAFVAEASATANGAKMPRANWDVLEKYQLVIAKGDVAHRFSALLTDILAKQAALIFKIRNLRRTRDLLLPRLLSGQIEVKFD